MSPGGTAVTRMLAKSVPVGGVSRPVSVQAKWNILALAAQYMRTDETGAYAAIDEMCTVDPGFLFCVKCAMTCWVA